MKILRPYQSEDIDWLSELTHAVHSAQPGLGKTSIALHVFERLRANARRCDRLPSRGDLRVAGRARVRLAWDHHATAGDQARARLGVA